MTPLCISKFETFVLHPSVITLLARKEKNPFKNLLISFNKKASNIHTRISSALKLDQRRSPKIRNSVLYQAKVTHLQACNCLLCARMPGDVSASNNPSPHSLWSVNENQD